MYKIWYKITADEGVKDMQVVTYSSFRRDMKAHMRATRDDADVILVTNNDPSENVVVMNQRDYESLMETIRIFENPYLYQKVLRGDERIARGDYSQHDLVDDERGADA